MRRSKDDGYHSVAEFAILASIAQDTEWPDGIRAELFSHPTASLLFTWMRRARDETGMWHPFAVAVTLERHGYDAIADDACDQLARTAPLFHPDNRRACLGLLIERQGRRAGKTVLEIVAEKRAARCPLSEAEIEAIIALRDARR